MALCDAGLLYTISFPMIVAASTGSKAGQARKRSRKDEEDGTVSLSSLRLFLDMAADALRAKSIANDVRLMPCPGRQLFSNCS